MKTSLNIKDFQKRIAKLRRSMGYTQSQLADILGVTQRAICYYENDSDGFPSAPILVKMAEIFNISLEELLGLDEIKPDARTIEVKTFNKLKKVAKLPKKDRDLVIQMVDNLIEKNNIS